MCDVDNTNDKHKCKYCEDVEWFGYACHHPVIYNTYPLRQLCKEIQNMDKCPVKDKEKHK